MISHPPVGAEGGVVGRAERAAEQLRGLHLPRGPVPAAHVRAIRETLFQHGRAIAATATRGALDVVIVVPVGQWSAAPLLLLRQVRCPALTFVPVDSDSALLARAAQRVRTALPEVQVRPCLSREPCFVPAEAFTGSGRHVLFLPWYPPSARAAEVAGLLGRDGCLLAGVWMREARPGTLLDRRGAVLREPPAWPPDLRPFGIWPDSHDVAALTLLEAAPVPELPAPGLEPPAP